MKSSFFIITKLILPIFLLISCTVGTPSQPLLPQESELKDLRSHAQNIEVIAGDLQTSTDRKQQLLLLEKLKVENQNLQRSALKLKDALKVSQESSQDSVSPF